MRQCATPRKEEVGERAAGRIGRNPFLSTVLTTRFSNAIAESTWNTHVWKPALAEAGSIPPRAKDAKQWQREAAPKGGFHVLRHTCASIPLEAGESVVTSARWARALLAGHPARSLRSLHAGSREQGAHRDRRTARGTGRSVRLPKLPGFSPGLIVADSPEHGDLGEVMDYKVKGSRSLAKC